MFTRFFSNAQLSVLICPYMIFSCKVCREFNTNRGFADYVIMFLMGNILLLNSNVILAMASRCEFPDTFFKRFLVS